MASRGGFVVFEWCAVNIPSGQHSDGFVGVRGFPVAPLAVYLFVRVRCLDVSFLKRA